mmetsp:Transcript_12103/g.33123  ORF Transcript_12103/g.33123 Transcript_12103/m.33123 type:complete len:106 (-) Transcript_12103:842-1159(-)
MRLISSNHDIEWLRRAGGRDFLAAEMQWYILCSFSCCVLGGALDDCSGALDDCSGEGKPSHNVAAEARREPPDPGASMELAEADLTSLLGAWSGCGQPRLSSKAA